MKKHLIFIFVISACLVMFGQKANALVTLHVSTFTVTFTDPYPCAGVYYTIEWAVVLTSPAYNSGWLQQTPCTTPGTYYFGPKDLYSVPEPNTGAYYQIIVRITKNCSGQLTYAYGYSNFLSYDIYYNLYPTPNDIKVIF
jgi:hypothetical protein